MFGLKIFIWIHIHNFIQSLIYLLKIYVYFHWIQFEFTLKMNNEHISQILKSSQAKIR